MAETFRRRQLCTLDLNCTSTTYQLVIWGHPVKLSEPCVLLCKIVITIITTSWLWWGFPGGASGKERACQPRRHETWVLSLGREDPLEGMTTHSSILAWRIPWTDEPGGLQFIGLQRVRHNQSDLACTQAWLL